MVEKKKTAQGIPPLMNAVRLHSPGAGLLVESVPVPLPGPGEVLVRMHAAPINPSDLKMLKERDGTRKYPFTPGLEGSGVVVLSGGGLLGRLRAGRRVACTPPRGGDGTWAEYMIAKAAGTVPLPASVTLEEGSMMLVNPMTAMALVRIARKGKHRAIVNNAAAGALGRMLISLGKRYGIPVISIVRDGAQAAGLSGTGAGHVLVSSRENFEKELRETAGALGATLFLDAVTGSQTGVLLRAAPTNATLIVYARLSGEEITADPADLIREGKQISGFQLGNWLQTKDIFFKLRFINRVKRELPGLLSTRVHSTMPMLQVEEAIAAYTRQMSAGKVLLMMNE